MNTDQLPATWSDESEAAPMASLTGACIHCLLQGTTCAASHPTAAQVIATKTLRLAA